MYEAGDHSDHLATMVTVFDAVCWRIHSRANAVSGLVSAKLS